MRQRNQRSTMDVQEITTIDSLLQRMGGCGLFQILAVIFVTGTNALSPWSMIFMAYGNYNPGWTCGDAVFNNSTSSPEEDPSLGLAAATNGTAAGGNNTSSCDAHTRCQKVVYNKAASTIVTEWDLVCDRSWIWSVMISLQMAGVLIGALSAGQSNHFLGRKATLYGSLALHASLNLLASFSVNWPMFTALRFFIGITTGSLMLTSFVYPMEFVTSQWRGLVSAVPFFQGGSVVFALTAMLLKDWRHLHQVTAIFAGVLIIPALWVPDSMRWLAVKDKIKEAKKVGLKIAKLNRKPVPNMDVISRIAEREKTIEKKLSRYTIVDLYRHGLLKRTLVLSLAWVTNTVVFYIIAFDVKSLSGNFFINLILFSSLTMAGLPVVPLFTNTIGRKWGVILLMSLAAVGCLVLVCLNFVETGHGVDKGLVTVVIAFTVASLVDVEWSIVQLLCVELYPTVLRSLSFSHGSSLARVGGMVAPFLIPRDPGSRYISQSVMLALVSITCLGVFLLPETKGRHLDDCVTQRGGPGLRQTVPDDNGLQNANDCERNALKPEIMKTLV